MPRVTGAPARWQGAGPDRNLHPARGVRLSAPDTGTCVSAVARRSSTAEPSQVKSIHTAIAIIIRFSVSDRKPSGTFELPPTQAHFSSRRSM